MNGIGASLVLDSQWNEGYCARIIVTNQHPSATTGTWSVELNLGASSAQDPWGGSFSGSTGQVTVNPAGYNAAIAPSQSTQFGFCASRPNRTVQATLVSVTSDLPPAGGGDVAPACPSARFEVDQADDTTLHQIKVMYVLPSDMTDEKLDTKHNRVCNSVASFTSWFFGQSGGSAPRLDTANGVLDIRFVRLPVSDAALLGTEPPNLRNRLEEELIMGGYIAPNKLYAVYHGGTNPETCGGGAYPTLIPGQVAAMYVKGNPGVACETIPWGTSRTQPAYMDYGMLHEIVHTLGFVAQAAPNHIESPAPVGHVFDDAVPPAEAARDLMYLQLSGNPPWDILNPDGLILDIGRDDYFDHGEPHLDLGKSAFLEPLPPDALPPPGW